MQTTQPSAFGVLLKRYRINAGLTQEALAERARLSARSISALECGVNQAPRRETVALLAAALQLPDEEAALLEETIARGRGPRRLGGSCGVPARQSGPPGNGRREADISQGAALVPSIFSEVGSPLILTPCGPGTWLLKVAAGHTGHAAPATGHNGPNGDTTPAAGRNGPNGPNGHVAPADARNGHNRDAGDATPEAGIQDEHDSPADSSARRKRMAPADRHAWVLAYLQMVEAISPREYARSLAIDRKTALTDLRALLDRGLLVARGTTTDRRYALR